MLYTVGMVAESIVIPPFSINPDPSLLYLTPGLKSALHKSKFVIDKRQGLTAILGDVGLGKSTVLRYLFNDYRGRDNAVAAMIHTPNFKSEFAFMKAICGDFGLTIRRSMQQQENELNEFLIEQYRDNKLVALFIDETQKLPGNQLELIRTLLNFETGTVKLIQVVMAAQLELREKLRDKSKRAIRSRIFAPSLLAPLTLLETSEMIDFRCEQAQIRNPFPPATVEAIYTATGGVPREILKVCSIAWDLAQTMGETQVPPEAIDASYNEAVLND
jgi:general secretion pathway protein A